MSDSRKKQFALSEQLNEVILIMEKLSQKGPNYWIKETGSGLRDIVYTFNNISRAKAIDDYFIIELEEIIRIYLGLIFSTFNQVLEDGYFDNMEFIEALDLMSVNIGREKINNAIQHWVIGSKTLFETPSYGICHRGSSLKIGKAYSIFLRGIEKAFKDTQKNEIKEELKFFCVPKITGVTKSQILFSDLSPNLGRLISLEICLEAFFDLATGFVLVAHEAGHYMIPGNRVSRNQAFMNILFDELARHLSMNLLFLPKNTENISGMEELINAMNVIILEWLLDDAELCFQNIYGDLYKDFILTDFHAMLQGYFESFSQDKDMNQNHNFDSLVDKLFSEFLPKANKFFDNELNGKFLENHKKGNRIPSDLEKIVGNLFNIGLNENSEPNKRKLNFSLKGLFCGTKVGSRIDGKTDHVFSYKEFTSFKKLGISFSNFYFELFGEIKADYFMIRLLKLSKKDYRKILLESSAFVYPVSETVDVIKQFEKRMEILVNTDCFMDSYKCERTFEKGMDNVHERMLINFINKDLSPAVDEMLQTHKLSKLQDYYCEFRLEKERGKYIVNEVELIEKILELE